jgi:hypothetical protein
MSLLRKCEFVDVPIITGDDGAADMDSPVVAGELREVQYLKDGTTPFADGVSMAITVKSTGKSVLAVSAGNMDASDQWCPVDTLDSKAGVEIPDAYAHVCVADDRFRVVIADGGGAKLGKIRFILR